MTASTDQTAADAARRVTVRSVASLVCLVLAAVLTVPAVIGYWGQRTLTDTQRYVATVGPLAAAPEVQDAVVASITDAFRKNVDVEALVSETFGEFIDDKAKLAALVPIVQGAVDSFVTAAAEKVVHSDQFQAVWTETNATLQREAIKFIEGESTAVQLVDNQVVLDTAPLIAEMRKRLVDSGLGIAATVQIPGAERQIVLLTSDELAQVRTIYGFAKPVATWLIGLVALLYLAAVLLARRRPRMVLSVGVAVMLTAFVIGLALAYGKESVTEQLQSTVFGPAASVFYSTLFAYLDDAWRTLFVLGFVLLVGGALAGSNRPGSAVRTYCRDGLEQLGARTAGPLGDLGRRVDSARVALRWLAVGLGALVLFWGLQVTVTRLWWTTALVVALVAAIQVLVGAGHGSPAESLDPVAAPA